MEYMSEPRHRGKYPRKSNSNVFNDFAQMSQKVQAGMDMPCSGTGRPLEDLRGGARLNARLANIGGGSKANGGGGIEQGMKNLVELGCLKTRAEIAYQVARQGKKTDLPDWK